MRQVQHTIGLPVLLPSGKSVGRVLDVWFDEYWRLTGIVLGTRVWFKRAVHAVRREDIVTWGEDALFIRSKEAIVVLEKKRLLRSFHTGVTKLKEMPVYTVDGQELGRVADVYFGPSEGTPIIGYELTDGFLADVIEGRRRLFVPEGPESVTLGEDAILVPASCGAGEGLRPIGESDR